MKSSRGVLAKLNLLKPWKLSEAGSVLIESTLTLLVAASLLTGGFFVTYVVFARVWLERETYESLVCLSSTSTANACEEQFRERTAAALSIGDHHATQSHSLSKRREYQNPLCDR